MGTPEPVRGVLAGAVEARGQYRYAGTGVGTEADAFLAGRETGSHPSCRKRRSRTVTVVRTLLRKLTTPLLLLTGAWVAFDHGVLVTSGGTYELVLETGGDTGVFVPYVSQDDGDVFDGLGWLLDGDGHKEASAPSRPRASWPVDERDSVTAAWMAAHRLVYAQPATVHTLEIEKVERGTPAWRAGVRTGDRVARVEGLEASFATFISRIWDNADSPLRPPLELELTDGREISIPVGETEGGRPELAGVTVRQHEELLETPPDVLRPGRMTGESFGLAAALVYAVHLAGREGFGIRVAATGVIEPDGEVIEVGGIREKMEAARRLGAEVVLVPDGNLADAALHLGVGVRLVAVSDLREAVDAVCAVASCPALLGVRR